MGAISLWFIAIYNALLHTSGHPPEDKIEERINFALSHAHLYLSESDDEQEYKSAAANTFDISCGGGGSISLLSAITVSVWDTSDVDRFLIFTSSWFPPNHQLYSDDMVDWDND